MGRGGIKLPQAAGKIEPDDEIEGWRFAREFPQTNKGRGVTLEKLHDSMVGSDLRRTSILLSRSKSLSIRWMRSPN